MRVPVVSAALAPALALFLGPASGRRAYEGVREVAVLAPAPATDAGVPLPAGEDIPLDDPSLQPAEGPSAQPADTTPAQTGGAPKTDEVEAPTSPDDLDLEDVFGSDETHTDVKAQAPSGPAADPSNAAPAGRRFAEKLRGKLETRIRVVSSAYYDVHKVAKRGFGRNENRLEFYFSYTPDRHLQVVGDIEPVFFGLSQVQALDDVATQSMLTPFHIESDAAYIALLDILPGLDVKIGRQIVVWGTADKFNPTNNINSDDLEDRPLFTEPIANQMVVVDYAPLQDKLWFQGVYVPMFYPALLPPSAAIALTDPQTPVPFAYASDSAKLGRLQHLLEIQPGLVPEVVSHVHMPSRRFTSGQSAIKLGTSLGGVDLTLSYYNGRHDIPTPALVRSSRKPADPNCPNTQKECTYRSDVTLLYPRMQVLGFDFTTQVPFLRNMGLWGEGALFFPQAQKLDIEFPITYDVTSGPNDDGITNPVKGMSGRTIRSTPYIKATAGADFTFGKHVYVQAQYLRGFIDEFGADHIRNYLVAGTDLIFFGRHFIFRAFGVVDFPTGKGDNGSYVIYPELIVTPPWGSVTLELGSFFLLGKPDTKFGQAASGSSIVFFKVAGTF